jgi:hypothetical protein
MWHDLTGNGSCSVRWLMAPPGDAPSLVLRIQEQTPYYSNPGSLVSLPFCLYRDVGMSSPA